MVLAILPHKQSKVDKFADIGVSAFGLSERLFEDRSHLQHIKVSGYLDNHILFESQALSSLYRLLRERILIQYFPFS